MKLLNWIPSVLVALFIDFVWLVAHGDRRGWVTAFVRIFIDAC